MAGTDWGVLSALRGRTDWNTIRADKQRELQYQAVFNQMQEQKNAEQMQKQQAMNEYLQTANNLNVLPKGMERIRAIDDELRQPIIEKIKKYGGDLDKYWKVEGQTDMQNYLNNLMHHPTTVKEIMNAANFSRWQADKQAGMQELTDIDSATGKPVNFFEEQVQKYNLGDTDELNYRGGYKPAKVDELNYGKVYGDIDKYKSVPYGASDFYDSTFRQLLDAGLSEQAAKHQASILTSSYKENRLDKGKPLFYKSDKRPVVRPTTAYANDNNALMSARFTVDQIDAVSSPNYNKWVNPREVNVAQVDPKTGSRTGSRKGIMKEADMVPIPLGKKTITYRDTQDEYDSNGKFVKQVQKDVTREVDDAIEPIINVDGKLYIQTTANRLEGKLPVPLESKSINKIILSTPKTPDGLRMIAAYRKVLQEKGVLDKEGLANFDMNNQQQRYVDANGNTVVDVDKLSPEQLQGLIDNGTISIAQ